MVSPVHATLDTTSSKNITPVLEQVSPTALTAKRVNQV